VIVVPLAELLRQRRDEWAALVAATPEATFFARAEWLDAWAAHATERRESFVALREERGRMVAGLPLQRGRGTIGRWRLAKWEVAGAPWLDRVDVARVDDAAGSAFVEELLDWLLAQRSGWTVLDLREATRDGFAIEAFARVAAERGLRVERRVCSKAPCFDVAAHGGRPPSANLRSQLARSGKRLAELGRVDVAFERPEPARLDALLDECAAVERESWKGRSATGILARAAPAAFFRPLFRALAEARLLAIGTLRLDGALHAYHLGFLHDGAFLSYNLANRAEGQQHGPGTLLLQAMAERAAALGITRLDASRGELERPHLLARYGGPVREHEQLLVWRPGARGAAVHLARTVVLPRLRALRRKPAKEKA